MAALETVADYLAEARNLLQDLVQPYRYPDDHLVTGLNISLQEVRRLRPDLLRRYLRTAIPSYSASSPTTAVEMEEQFRIALAYYMAGYAQLQDDEESQDTRAAGFIAMFMNTFTVNGVRSA